MRKSLLFIPIGFLALFLSVRPIRAEEAPAPAQPPVFDETLESLLIVLPAERKTDLDQHDVQRLRSVLQPVFDNDDKKAKLAYGRNYKFLPPGVQFAFDLRFKNYAHALEVLKDIRKSDEEKAIWEKFIKSEPKDLATSLCELIKTNKDFPSEKGSAERMLATWVGAASEIHSGLKSKVVLSSYSKKINDALVDFKCLETKKVYTKGCPDFNEKQKKEIQTDEFMDLLRNAQRRSSAYWAFYKKNESKLALDPDSFNREPLLSLYGSILTSQAPNRNQMHRRLRGVAKDMRLDSLERRGIGALILEDRNDALFVKKLRSFVQLYPLVSLVNNLDTRLASCSLPEVKAWNAPR